MGNRHPTLLVLRHMVSYVLILATLVHLSCQQSHWNWKEKFKTVCELHLSASQESMWKREERSLWEVCDWHFRLLSHRSGLLRGKVTLEEKLLPFVLHHLNWEKRHGKKHDHLVSKIQTHSLCVMHLDILMLQMVQGVCLFVCIRLCSICGSVHIGHKTCTNSTLHTVHLQRLVGLWTLLLCNMRRKTVIEPIGLPVGSSHSQTDLPDAGLCSLLYSAKLW